MPKTGRSSRRRAPSLATTLRIMGYKVGGRCPVKFELYNQPQCCEFDLKLTEVGVYILIVGTGNSGEAAARQRGLKRIERARRAGIGCLWVEAEAIFDLQSPDDKVRLRAQGELRRLIEQQCHVSHKTARAAQQRSRQGRRQRRAVRPKFVPQPV